MTWKKQRNDFIAVCIVLAIALVGYGARFLSERKAKGEPMVVVMAGDEIVGRYPLHRDMEKRIAISDTEYNDLVIKDGKASVTEATCPDQICVQHSAISTNHEMIVCLPHELIVEIQNGDESGVDAVSQ